jgi:hypothetical protein
MNDKVNYLKYTRTELYYNYILPIQNTLYDNCSTTDDKLIKIHEIIKLLTSQDKKPR